jgi:hypothetical protein
MGARTSHAGIESVLFADRLSVLSIRHLAEVRWWRLFDDEGPHALVRKNTRVEIAPNFPYETFGIGIVFSLGHFLQILFCSFSCAVRKGRLFASFPVTRLGINQLVQS